MVRAKSICPIKQCKKACVNLPRHMRSVHNWNEEESKKVKQLYGLRKMYQFKKQPNSQIAKKYRPTKACPVYGCRSMVKNVSRHIKTLHKFDDQEEFNQLISCSVIVDLNKKTKSAGTTSKSHFGNHKDEDYKRFLVNDVIASDDDDSSTDLTYHPQQCMPSDNSNCNDSSKSDTTASKNLENSELQASVNIDNNNTDNQNSNNNSLSCDHHCNNLHANDNIDKNNTDCSSSSRVDGDELKSSSSSSN